MVNPAPEVTENTLGICPRCDAHLLSGYDEFFCLRCGYVKYDAPRETKPPRLRHRTRYVGDLMTLKHRVVSYHYGGPKGTTLVPACPWCWEDMESVNLSGLRKNKDDTWFVCPSDHRIMMLDGTGGVAGWR